MSKTNLKIRLLATIAFIIMLFQISVALPGKTLHPMSVGLSLNAARMFPWAERNDIGYGSSFSFQFDFDTRNSMMMTFSCNYIGKDTYYSQYSNSIPLTIRITDYPFQVGYKRYFLSNHTRPFFTLTLDSHNLRKKYTYSKNVDPDLYPGLSASIGLEKQIRARYFFNAEICVHTFQYYSYPVLRLGLRYHFKSTL